jgi:dihydropyrimidinase
MLDLIIRGGDVVTPQGVVQGDVAVAGETIAAIAAADVLSAETAKHAINAKGHIVIPGGIDPHVHLHHVWFKPDGTPLITAGPEQVGRAALHGGTTTFIDFAYWRDGATALEAIENRDRDFVGKSPCDWAYHIMLHSEPPPEFSSQLALHETDYTPWEGHDIFAWPVITILRGKVMVEHGQYLGSSGDGRYLKRKISSQTLGGAML